MAALRAADRWYAFRVSKIRTGLGCSCPMGVAIGSSRIRETFASMCVRVLREAPVDELRRIPVNDSRRHVRFVQFLELELDLAAGLDASQQEPVNVRLGDTRIFPVRRQWISHRSSSAYNPSGKNAAILAPVSRIEDVLHEKMGMALKRVDVLVGLVLRFQ